MNVKNPDNGAAPGAYVTMRRVLDVVDGALVAIGALMLFVLMCLVVADVSMRYLFNAPLQWSFEVISNYLMPGLFFLAVSHTLKAHSHVAVDIVHNYVGAKTRYTFQSISCALAVPAFAICAWKAAGVTLGELNLRGRTGATVVALTRGGQPMPLPSASTRIEAGDLLALTGSGNAIGLAAALLHARDTSLPPSATDASAPPGA